MAAKANLLAVLAVLFSFCIARADTPTLIGSSIKTDDAIQKSRVVFVGQLAKLGEPDDSVDHDSLGPEYPQAKVKVLTGLKGTFDAGVSVGIYPNSILKEETPKERGVYIFFVKYESNASTPYIVLKLLPATDDNIAMVKKLISN